MQPQTLWIGCLPGGFRVAVDDVVVRSTAPVGQVYIACGDIFTLEPATGVRGFVVTGNNATISDVYMGGLLFDGDGGCVHVGGAARTFTIRDSVLALVNVTGSGGALYASSNVTGDVTVERVTFQYNLAGIVCSFPLFRNGLVVLSS